MKKIELAQGLLSVGGITITEISDKCGFSDVYYFSKVFKQFTGKSPSNWK
jgi:YesN/AraC family two-component response regulator